MNYYCILVISALSVALPAFAGLLRRERLYGRYAPLLALFWTGLVNECLSLFLIQYRGNNIANSNGYTFIEFLLFLWLFHKMTQRNTKAFFIAALCGMIVWTADNLILHNLHHDNTFFRAASFLTIIYMALERISELVFEAAVDPYLKTELLLSTGIFVYYSYQAFITVFDMFRIGVSSEFYVWLWVILGICNMATNIVYTIAILWIPKRKAYFSR